MYVSTQMLRVHHDEWLRHAETHRLIKQAAASSGAAARVSQRGRRQLGLRRGLGLRRRVSPA
jgi:hypothetical protein